MTDVADYLTYLPNHHTAASLFGFNLQPNPERNHHPAPHHGAQFRRIGSTTLYRLDTYILAHPHLVRKRQTNTAHIDCHTVPHHHHRYRYLKLSQILAPCPKWISASSATQTCRSSSTPTWRTCQKTTSSSTTCTTPYHGHSSASSPSTSRGRAKDPTTTPRLWATYSPRWRRSQQMVSRMDTLPV